MAVQCNSAFLNGEQNKFFLWMESHRHVSSCDLGSGQQSADGQTENIEIQHVLKHLSVILNVFQCTYNPGKVSGLSLVMKWFLPLPSASIRKEGHLFLKKKVYSKCLCHCNLSINGSDWHTNWNSLRGFCLSSDTVKSAVSAECFCVCHYSLKAAVESLPFFFFLSIHLFPNAIWAFHDWEKKSLI